MNPFEMQQHRAIFRTTRPTGTRRRRVASPPAADRLPPLDILFDEEAHPHGAH